jgi:hypothetical protein
MAGLLVEPVILAEDAGFRCCGRVILGFKKSSRVGISSTAQRHKFLRPLISESI